MAMVAEPTARKGTGQRKEAATDLAQRAYEEIRRLLFLNEFAPGQKLQYREVASRLGMSPTPVAQALKWLAHQGLLRHEPNRGFCVEPMSVEEVEEIYELRETLEVGLLPKSFERADAEWIDRLRRALEAHLAVHRERYLKQRLIADMEFHLALVSPHGGKIARRILRELFDLLYTQYRAEILFSRPMEDAGSEHQAIFDSVAARDLEGASRLLSAHLRSVREHVVDGLRKSREEREALAL